MTGPDESAPYAHEVDERRPSHARRFAAGVLTSTLCAFVTACSFLSPASDTSRHFVLTSLPQTGTADAAPGTLRVDVIHVKIPSYLSSSSLAVRKGSNEIVYLPGTFWAERLNIGVHRVLAADLSSLLRSEQLRAGAGSSEDAAREIGVTIEQFDVSSSGQAVLVAKWRVFSPGGEKILHSGESRISRSGPAPDADPSGAVGTLSDLIADLSRQLAQALTGT